MITPDRINGPLTHQIGSIQWTQPQVRSLANDAMVYCLGGLDVDVVKIELIFPAGTKYHKNLSVGSFTQQLLKEGTVRQDSSTFNDAIDYYGAFVSVETDRDYLTISVFCRTAFVHPVMALVHEMIMEPRFDADLLEIKKRNSIQNLLTNRKKVAFQSRVGLIGAVLGEQHYYGRISDTSDMQQVERADLVAFHAAHYFKSPPRVIVAGKITPDVNRSIEEFVGSLPVTSAYSFQKLATQTTAGIHRRPLEGAIQQSIRLGKLTIGPSHADATALDVAITALGGYFGSRLMDNLRERNGFTYGVHMSIDQFQEGAMISMHTELGKEYCDDALREIDLEFEKFLSEGISEDELQTVKNYLCGSLVKEADGSIAQSELLRFRLLNGLPDNAHEQVTHKIQHLSVAEVNAVAQKYLQRDSFVTVIAG
ncbi:MAG TPA: pitrilysin family protein [Luteibaculaceae bacterium]|nr:pitrilysin family protein [Luteibaculaceae bacterium]